MLEVVEIGSVVEEQLPSEESEGSLGYVGSVMKEYATCRECNILVKEAGTARNIVWSIGHDESVVKELGK